jgi:hypothetical protein
MKENLGRIRGTVRRIGQKLVELSQPPEVPASQKIEKTTLTPREIEEISETAREVLKDYGTKMRTSQEIADFFDEKQKTMKGLHPVLAQAFDDMKFAFGEHMLYANKKEMTGPEEVASYLKKRLLPEKFDF